MIFQYLSRSGPRNCELTIGRAGTTLVAHVRDVPGEDGDVVDNMESIATLVYHRYFRPLGVGMNDIAWFAQHRGGDTAKAIMTSGMGRYFIPEWLTDVTEPNITEPL